jgi:chemotaxis protein MotB
MASAAPASAVGWRLALWSTATFMSNDDTGIIVSPPKGRGPARGNGPGGGGSGPVLAMRRKHLAFTALWMVAAAAVGAAAVFLAMRQQVAAAEARLAAATADHQAALDARGKQQATAFAAELAAAKAKVDQAEQKLAAEKAAAEKALADKATQAKALEDKLEKVLAGQGEVTQSGGAIRLEVVDKVLFSVGQSEITERGKAVLGKLGTALAEATDKQIWVQGHTDDQPITPDKGVTPTFPSNWELASARALSVVHYLQDVSKVDPSRLAAVAFGQYRPISRTKAKNRRIEIVLYPKIDVKPR